MNHARHRTQIASALAIASCLAVAVFSPSEVMAAAGGIQNCTAGSTCTVGEFLYDDTSAPINTATCTITSRYPDDTSLYAAVAMTAPTQSDGWYSKTFTAPTTTGLYRTSVTCTVSGEDLSIDKSFEVNAATSTASIDNNAVAAAVWSYSSRTVTSFGSLVSDIWNSTLKTSTTGTAASNDDILLIKKNTSETRLLMEKVVNKPIIQNVLESTTTPVSEKLNGTRSMANQLYVNDQFLIAQSATLASSWNKADGKELLDNVIALSNVLGSSADSSDANTMFGSANWIKDSWNWDESAKIYNQLVETDKLISDLKEGLANYQKTPALYAQAKLLVKNTLILEKTIGKAGDLGTQKTLFSKIKTTQDLASSLDDKGSQVDKVLGAYVKSKDAVSAVSQIKSLQNQIIALNKVPQAGNALVKINPADDSSIRNVLLGLKGIVDSNKMLLALGSGKTLINSWLEIGSIVIKTLVTNPSTLISQNVDVKYYLPQELKKEDIIKTDPGLVINYDAEKDQLYVEGSIALAPGQTKTFSVETKDIWSFTPEELGSLKKQADDLFAPLQKTAYFAQAVTLRSDINANIDQITNLQDTSVTPEDKIKAYRQSVVLKKSIDDKLLAMKELVGQASAAGSLFGFVGGSQTIAVWGLIVVIAAGFVFMTIYMRTVTAKAKAANQAEASEEEGSQTLIPAKKKTHLTKVHPLGLVAVMLVSSTLSAAGSAFAVNTIVSKSYEQKMEVLGTETSAPVVTPAPQINYAPTPETSESLGTGGQYLVIVSETPTGLLNVRKTPGGAVVVSQVKTGDKLPYIEENKMYYKVQLESGEEGWVSKEYSSKE